MEHNSLGCQVCLTKFKRVFEFKKHLYTRAHQEKMKEVFQKNMFKSSGSLPNIVVMNLLAKKDFKQPIIGLSLLTMCFSPETNIFFYLCHVCEEKCPPDRLVNHLSSGDHCSNYFNYTDPDVLSFSWVPSKDMGVILRPALTKDVNERGPGLLQMLDLPENLLKKLETSTYSEVMHTLSENDKLLKLLEAVKPKRMMIQTYQRDSNRKHPLLGMQHLVECICVGPTEKRYYLCTLCNLTLATHMIIKHVLSFDHIFCYFRAWHPSTLLSKECYKDYTTSFASMILDFAKQTEEIHGTANTDMKQVSLEPAEFTSVNFTCYAEALKELESITKESSFITSVKPGNKLEFRTMSAGSVALSYKLRCQACSMSFETIYPYLRHLSTWKHKQMMKKFFGEDKRAGGYDQRGCKPNLGLYTYLKESLMENQPAIGIPLVVTCISTQAQVEPICVCFACEDCFSESFVRQHFNSRKHLVHTLLYQNPWRLPFAWENHLDVKVLRSMAWEEEKERGPNQMMLKVVDLPDWIFCSLSPPSYPKVMKRLELHHALLKREVPPRETYSKLKQNERFPLLGGQFLVMHDVQHPSTEVGFLCLLCKRRLSDDECYAHVFSREHVAKFLDCFHPGSLNPSTDADTLLDLAKQAARIHSISHVQVIKLDKPIWEPCSYHKAIYILSSTMRRGGKGKLEPPIMPKMKLVPREILKDMDKDHARDNSQENSRMMEESEKKTSQKSTDSETTLKKMSVESGENAEKGADKETPSPSENESEKRSDEFSKTLSEEKKNAGSETCQAIKEEKIEEPTARRPSGETLEICQNTDKNDGTEIGEQTSKSSKDVPTQWKNYTYKENERKRPSSMCENSQEDTCPNEDVEKEMAHKRQRLTSKQDTSCEEPHNLQSSGQKEATTADEGESGKPSHETAKDKASSNVNHQQADQLWQYVKRKSREPVVGLSALHECHCDQRDPIYLCECCSLKISEKDIISHVTGVDHQTMYLAGLQELPPPPEKHGGKKIKYLAALFEQDKGYGEAQVVDLEEEIYNNISKQNFKSAIQTVKACQAQQDSGRELPSTSALSDVQPVDTSVYSMMDDFQVVEMEIDDDSEDSAAVSVTTEITSKTTEVPPESNEDVKMTHIKVSESADNADTCLTVCRSSEDTSSLHMSTSGTNTTHLHPDSTGNKSKAEIISNTTVGPLNIATTFKIVGTSQTAATSDSTVTTPTKSMTTISKYTAKSSNSTPDTTKSTATTYSSTTATTKLRETANKYPACTSSAPATTSKFTATAPKLTGTTSTFSATISSMTSTTKSAPVSKPLDRRTGAAAKIESKNSETASQTMVTSAATAKMTKTSVKCENNKASAKTVHMKNSVGSNADVAPNIHKSNAPTPPHQTTHVSVRSENKNPPTEPSHTSASKTKPSKSKVGADQLILVSCEGKQQVYCQLCSVRMQSSSHLFNLSHWLNYVKMKYPGWTAKLSDPERQLDKMVTHLAEVERAVGSRANQRIEVNIGVYKELGALPEDKAVERLKAMMRQRDSQVSSSSTTDAAEVLRQQVSFASPCEVSSPDDVMYMPQNEMAGLSTDNQSEQNKDDLQTLLPKIESVSKEEGNVAAGQSDRAQSLKGKGPEANDLISDQLHSCPTLKKNDPEPTSTPSIQDAEIAVNVKQETFECDVESQAKVEVTPAIESPGKQRALPLAFVPATRTTMATRTVKMEEPQDPLATDSESTGRFAQTPDTCQEAPEKRQQQERSDPELQDTQKLLEGTQKTSPVKFFNADPLPSTASVNTEQQNQSRPSQKAEHAPKHSGCSPGPGHHSASQALPRISVGERTEGCSQLSTYLTVKGLKVIGLSSVWECRGISSSNNTFFLCESCRETLSNNDICQHMVSDEHQFKYMRTQYPQFLLRWDKDLTRQMKLDLSRCIAQQLSDRECLNNMDAQGILLGQELYECVRTAPFSKALKMVQNIKREQRLSVVCTPQQKDQQPEDRQSQEESLPTEMQSAQALETDQRSDNEARQETEKHHLEETALVGDLDGVKQRRVLSPVDVTSVSSKADSVVPPFPGAGTCPQETCRSLSMQPELRPPVSQHQRPILKFEVKQVEVHSESPSSSIVSPKTCQTLSVSPRDKCLPTRKRPAVTSLETLVRHCTNNPQLEDPLPAKCTHSSLQPISQPSPESASGSTPVNPAATSTLLSPKDKDTGPGSDKQDTSIVDWTQFTHLVALVREMKSEINVCPRISAPDNAETTTSWANNSSESGVERRSDPKSEQTKMAKKQTGWDSNLVKATVKQNPPSTDSLEGMFSTAAPVVLGHENQLVTPNANFAFSANNSSLEGYLTRGNLLFRATEAKAVSTTLPSASTADPSDPQHQRSVNAQSVFGNVSQFKPSPFDYVATNRNPGEIPQPRGNTETDSTGVCQLPINTIVTVRPDPTKSGRTPQQFMGGYNGQDHTEVNRGNQVAQSFSTVATASPSDTLAASGGCGQYSQMAYVTNGHSGYLSSEAVAGFTAPANPPVYTGSLYQHEGSTTMGLYPSQIYPEQEANRFGHSLATPAPPGWVRLEMQQQQQLLLMQQQQQQLSSWTSAALAAGDGNVTNEAAYLGVPFTTPANNSQRCINLNEYSTKRIVPMLNSNNIITQNTAQVYLNPPVIHHPPTANSEIISQASANSFFGREFFTVAPSMVNATPPVSHETTN